jgi:hypothetical protein
MHSSTESGSSTNTPDAAGVTAEDNARLFNGTASPLPCLLRFFLFVPAALK